MSKSNIFGTTGIDFKNQYENPDIVAEAYKAYSNLFGDAIDEGAELKDWIQSVYHELGDLQGSVDNTPKSDIDSYNHFPVTEYQGHMVPQGFVGHLNGGDDSELVKNMAQSQLRDNLGTSADEPEPESKPEPSSPDRTESDSQSDMEAFFEDAEDEVKGLGPDTAENLRSWIKSQERSISHEDIEMEVPVTEKYDSMDEVPPHKVSELSPEQIAEIQG